MIEVLIVEDEPRVAEIQRRFLQKMDGYYLIGIANTGSEALDWLDVMKPQLVLLDIYLPDMKGIDLIWEIRQNYREIDLIMITAAGEIEIIQEALRGGVFDYLVKPVRFERFQQSLTEYREHVNSFSNKQTVDQVQLDTLLRREIKDDSSIEHLPKGIDPVTLRKVRNSVAKSKQTGLTAEQLGEQIGASRTTARRYLEYLVSIHQVTADLSYGTIGRPERKYFADRS